MDIIVDEECGQTFATHRARDKLFNIYLGHMLVIKNKTHTNEQPPEINVYLHPIYGLATHKKVTEFRDVLP